MHNILFVDDEKCILDSLTAVLRKEPYNIITAESGSEALEVLENESVAMIISDVLMPGMDGIELLKRASELSPHSIKILLSGFSEVEMIIEAINSGLLWRYLLKPWNNDDLVMTIRSGIDYYQLNMDNLKLLEELKFKNEELENLNQNLEEKVQQRTYILKNYNDLLIQLLDGIPINTFLHNIVDFLSYILCTKHISLIIPGETSYNTYSSSEIKNSEALTKVINVVQVTNDNYYENGISAIPITHNGIIYAIVIYNSTDDIYINNDSIFETLTIILRIALQRYRLVDKTEHLISDIDKLLEECH